MRETLSAGSEVKKEILNETCLINSFLSPMRFDSFSHLTTTLFSSYNFSIFSVFGQSRSIFPPNRNGAD